ncbi:hypothetical protein AKJ64_04590 [candidate division MSBL1 archaeon SCGC-AAA259E17]|uniref:Uncharacterized protein n=1 Tax=candidate division MSBL1 archaeon SCGC-AAA259E17 TaxID=1698263 RepID=A0A133UBX1_9EURY|nr:hypothetical protein AKJ64_04590 [candidate division MSBL1 archaeon SCGC-AAA259E17]
MSEKTNQIEKLLSVPEYMAVFLFVAGGNNYASAIAKRLDKKQPTASKQLKKLEETELIEVAERGKAKKFKVNWDIFFEMFYNHLNSSLEYRKGTLIEDIKDINSLQEEGLRNLVPPELVKTVFKGYTSGIEVVGGGRKKGFGEMVMSFFSALKNMHEEIEGENYWEKLIEEYNVGNEDKLYELADTMEIYNWFLEYNAITSRLLIGPFEGKGNE